MFMKYLYGLGVPNPPAIFEETVDEYKAQFFYLVDWIREDPKTRKYLCKTRIGSQKFRKQKEDT